mgnify:CR=1 FL=1
MFVEICHTKSLAIPAGLFYNNVTIIFQSFSDLFRGRILASFHEKSKCCHYTLRDAGSLSEAKTIPVSEV